MLDNESRDPTYLAQTRPGTTDHYGRIIPRGWLRALQLDLTSASAAGGIEKKLSGDFLFLDRNTSGVITVQLNDPTEYGIPMGQFDMLEGIPIDRVILSWAAQPGLKANLWYGYQARLKATAGVSDISDRSGRLLGQVFGDLSLLRQQQINAGAGMGGAAFQALAVRDFGYAYGASFDSSANLGINASEQIFAAASNVNGALLWECDIFTQATTGGTSIMSLVSHTVAPTVFSDGHKHFLVGDGVATAAGNTGASGNMPRSKFVAAGRGAWFFNSGSVAEGAARRRVQYTLF